MSNDNNSRTGREGQLEEPTVLERMGGMPKYLAKSGDKNSASRSNRKPPVTATKRPVEVARKRSAK
jgi:hypothetical protein